MPSPYVVGRSDHLVRTPINDPTHSEPDVPTIANTDREDIPDVWLPTRCGCRTCEQSGCKATAVIINYAVKALCWDHAEEERLQIAPFIADVERTSQDEAGTRTRKTTRPKAKARSASTSLALAMSTLDKLRGPCWQCEAAPISRFLAARPDADEDEIEDALCDSCLNTRASRAPSLEWAIMCADVHELAGRRVLGTQGTSEPATFPLLAGYARCEQDHPPTRHATRRDASLRAAVRATKVV